VEAVLVERRRKGAARLAQEPAAALDHAETSGNFFVARQETAGVSDLFRHEL
jgi:hypothetical protein